MFFNLDGLQANNWTNSKRNVKLDYGNSPKPIVDSVFEMVKNEMKKSLEICP
jgi:hypothetical protein